MAGLPAVVPIYRDVGRPTRIRTSNGDFGDPSDNRFTMGLKNYGGFIRRSQP